MFNFPAFRNKFSVEKMFEKFLSYFDLIEGMHETSKQSLAKCF
jgi:hypothetical protein